MTPPNWTNRTVWTGDNLDIMRGMNSKESLSHFGFCAGNSKSRYNLTWAI